MKLIVNPKNFIGTQVLQYGDMDTYLQEKKGMVYKKHKQVVQKFIEIFGEPYRVFYGQDIMHIWLFSDTDDRAEVFVWVNDDKGMYIESRCGSERAVVLEICHEVFDRILEET